MLEERNYAIHVLDNLSKGSTKYIQGSNADIRVGDIRDRSAVAVVEKEEKEKQPGSVMFFFGIRII